jgi:uncharacterized protein (DUF4415 family)/uncharacterized DUF497 family protein
MAVEFDPDKDAANIAKHGVSLSRAADFEILAFVEDDRSAYGETRFRAWGLIDAMAHCLVFTRRGQWSGRSVFVGRTRRRWIAMSRKIVRKIVIEDENPEWTLADFEKARPARELPPDILKAFPKTRGPQKLAKKVPISIRLSADVVERFKAAGPGWQARIDEALKKAVGL